MSQLNFKRLIKLGLVVFLTAIIFIFVFAGMTAFILSDFKTLRIASYSEWIPFYGSLFGGLLGGCITMVGVVITILYTMKDKQLDRMPILRFENHGIRDENAKILTYFPPHLTDEQLKDDQDFDESRFIDSTLLLEIRNIGFTPIKSFGFISSGYVIDPDTSRFNTLGVNEAKTIKLCVPFYKDEIKLYHGYEDTIIAYYRDYHKNLFSVSLYVDYAVSGNEVEMIYHGHSVPANMSEKELHNLMMKVRY